ncbi:hypothetical protein RIF29_34631 [Crotalaria pallida]|uniref:Uncharacterized protein n=1 Tax=Crotalaria pallida TaxID=3830 RepID=A0AAN9HTM1_CROPI
MHLNKTSESEDAVNVESMVTTTGLVQYEELQSALEPQVEFASATAYTPIESSYVPSEAHVASESATIANNAKPEMPKVSKTKSRSGESPKASIDPKATDSEIHEPKSKRGSGTMMATTEPMATDSAPRTYDQILNLLNEPEIKNMVKALSNTYDMMQMAREAETEKKKALENDGPSTQFSTTKEKK